MSPDTRSLVAAIAWTVQTRASCAWVYDYDRETHRPVSASATDSKLGAYDHTRRTILEGTLGALLTDHADGARMTIERTAAGVKGYDYASEAFYEAVVEADRVSLYDYADGLHHAYAVRG